MNVINYMVETINSYGYYISTVGRKRQTSIATTLE